MKKKNIMALIVVLVLLLLVAAPAWAATEGVLAGETETEFFTWTSLATSIGATMATLAVTQLIKGWWIFDKLPTRILASIIALAILLAATAFSTGLTWDSGFLCAINAVVVGLAANGAYDAVTAKRATTTKNV